MTYKFACPKCQKSIKVDAKLAGKAAKCPGCASKLKIPAPPQTTYAAASVGAQAGATATRQAVAAKKSAQQQAAPSSALPFDEDEWNEEFNPFASPKSVKEEKPAGYDKPKIGVTRKQFAWTRRGLWTVFFGIFGDIICRWVLKALYKFSSGEATDAVSLIDIVSYIQLGCVVFSALGAFLCMTVPAKIGASRSATLAGVFYAMYVTCLVIPLTGAVTASNDLALVAMLVVVGDIGAYFAFLTFLKQIATFFKRKELLEKTNTLINFGVGIALLWIAAGGTSVAVLFFETTPWLLIVSGLCALGALIGMTIAVYMYAALVGETAEALS